MKSRKSRRATTRGVSRRAAKPSSESARAHVLRQFRIIIKSVRSHYREVEKSAGISGAQLWALAHVADHPGSTVGELAKALAIHVSTASNLVTRLDAVGLVSRLREAGLDQRVVRLRLTPAGTRVVNRAPRPLIGVLQQALSSLPPQRLDSLQENLAALITRMRVTDPRARDALISEM